jgi:hypothetical protein
LCRKKLGRLRLIGWACFLAADLRVAAKRMRRDVKPLCRIIGGGVAKSERR